MNHQPVYRTNAVMLSLQEVQSARLEQTSNNIANATTHGFQSFCLKVSEKKLKALDGGTIAHVSVDKVMRNVSNGSIEKTSNHLDVAIIGQGYFKVQTPKGIRYTRNGQFQIGNDGYLANAHGYHILSESDEPVFIGESDAKIYISKDGVISNSERILGKIGVFYFDDEQELTPEGSSLYFSSKVPFLSSSYSIANKALEGSNVSLMKEAISLMEIQKLFEQAKKIMDEYEKSQRKAINISNKV